MATGQEIKQIYDAMKQICIETGNLISVVNDSFVKRKYNPLFGNRVMWDLSRSYLSPESWLPYFQQRIFVKNRGGNSKGVGINILFDDDNLANKIPVISCGVLFAKSGKSLALNNDLYYAGWANGSIYQENEELEGLLYKTSCDENSVYKHIINYFIPLDIITGQKAVEEYIVEPLIMMYGEKFSEAERMIESCVLTIDDIKT